VLLDLIDRRSAELRVEANTIGARIFVEKPNAFGRPFRGYWEAWRSEARASVEKTHGRARRRHSGRMTSPFGAANSDRPYLAHAAWVRAKLLLLDEHTAALDPKSADQVIRLTDDIVSRDKLTTLMVTHSMQQAASLGDRLVMMHRGWVIHDLRGAEKRRARVDETATERCCGGHTSDQFLRS
jgi:ABC-type uncharacterized transport system ATPase component